MIDFCVSVTLVLTFAALAAAYATRVAARGVFHSSRADAAGQSVLLGRGLVAMAYWVASPIVRGLVGLGITANAITSATVALSLTSAIALAEARFGIGAGLGTIAFACDALDGLVARETNTARPSGELFDASADRCSEFLFLGALAIHFRDSAMLLALVLAALFGAFMVSYGSARAAALGLVAPRGAMQRAERAVYLTLGAGLVPLAARITTRANFAELPLIAALALVAVIGNVSAVRRLIATGHAADQRADRRQYRPADEGSP
jgi:CDP-diacylglycerol--glycerol-3-phosphate 3-phosphatidyltransferase